MTCRGPVVEQIAPFTKKPSMLEADPVGDLLLLMSGVLIRLIPLLLPPLVTISLC